MGARHRSSDNYAGIIFRCVQVRFYKIESK